MSKPSNLVKDRWNAKAYDNILLRVKSGGKNKIKQAAKVNGKSLNTYIVGAIDQRMEREKSPSD